MLVEDHGVTAQMISAILQERSHRVEVAGDIGTALELSDQQAFDLLLSDLGLPDGSGYDLIRELRFRGHSFPGIALSGYGQENDIRRSYEAGFSAHLVKPASREALEEAIASVTTGNGYSASSGSTQSGRAPVFDAEKALERCYGQHEMLTEMINLFPAESAKLLAQIRTAIDKGDLTEAGKAAHRLKGNLVYLAAQPAADSVAKFERESKSGDHEAAVVAFPELERQVELLRGALEANRR